MLALSKSRPALRMHSRMAKTITASVGIGGVNRTPDVRNVQQLLNKVPSTEGGPSVKLVEDGISGQKTRSAIHAFQVKHFGWAKADSQVDPGRQTLSRLNDFDRAASPVPAPPPQPPQCLPARASSCTGWARNP